MRSDLNFDTYLFLSSENLIINVVEKKSLKDLYFDKKKLNPTNKVHLNFEIINSFLEKNIFVIEKRIKSFIQSINLIIKTEKFFTVEISVKKKNFGEFMTNDNLIHLLNEAKDEAKNTIDDRKIIHMIIKNYFIDGRKYSYFPKNYKCKSISIDLEFICLSNEFIQNIEKILNSYQISLNRILNSDYVDSLNFNKEDIFRFSTRIIEGYNENEVSIVPKNSDNKGFFERFFNFFN
tara:strand:+ start:14205 stop:14909 length:705 start_codon:yes stop_codon:yes gene_type:complete